MWLLFHVSFVEDNKGAHLWFIFVYSLHQSKDALIGMCFKDKMFSVYQIQLTGYKDKGQKQDLAWQQKHEFSTINDTDRFNKGSSILDLEGVEWKILAPLA